MTQPPPLDPTRPAGPVRDPRTDPTRHAYYGGRNKDGSPCDGMVVEGTETCRMHAGISLAKLRAKGAVVVELRQWGLNGHTELADPGEVLLRLVTQSAARVELYSRLLGEAFDAAERLKAAVESGDLDEEEPLTALELVDGSPRIEVDRARRDLQRVFNTGGISAFVGFTYSATRDGDLFATGEAIRGLAAAEAAERDRCASFAAKAIAAGLAERQVRLAESQGRVMFEVFGRVQRRLLEALDLSPGQLEAAGSLLPRLLAEEVGALTGRQIEGSAS